MSKQELRSFEHRLNELLDLQQQLIVAQAMLIDVKNSIPELEAMILEAKELEDNTDKVIRRMANRWFESGQLPYEKWVELQ